MSFTALRRSLMTITSGQKLADPMIIAATPRNLQQKVTQRTQTISAIWRPYYTPLIVIDLARHACVAEPVAKSNPGRVERRRGPIFEPRNAQRIRLFSAFLLSGTIQPYWVVEHLWNVGLIPQPLDWHERHACFPNTRSCPRVRRKHILRPIWF